MNSNAAVEHVTDKAAADELDGAAQNAKRALRNLNNHLDARKCSIEDQVAEAQSLVDDIAANLKEQDKVVQKSNLKTNPSASVKAAAEDKVKKVRRQLDQNLDKLQEAFASCGSSSAAQAKARAIAKDTHEGYKEVVEATLAANLDCVTTRKAMQDSQQLMNWTLEILVEGTDSLGPEKRKELISSADEVLHQMTSITDNVKAKTRDKRSLDDVKAQMEKLLKNIDGIKDENKKQKNVSKEDALDKLTNSREMIQDLLYNIKEAYSNGKKLEAEEQVKLLTDAMKDFDLALRAFASTESDPAKRARLSEGAKELMRQTSDLIDLTKVFDGSCEEKKKAGAIMCEEIEDTLLDIVKPIQAAAENEKISNIFMKQSGKVNESADNLQEDPTTKNLEKVKKDVDKMMKCMKVLSKMEENPELKSEIDLKITELNDALEALKRAMIPPVNPEKLAKAIEDLKMRTSSINEMVSQSLMMKEVAEASKRAIDKANKNFNKGVGSISGDLDKNNNNVLFKKEVEKASSKVEEYEQDPMSLITRSDMMRQTSRMAENVPNSMPKQVTDAFVELQEKIQNSKPVTRTLDIDASDLRVKKLQDEINKLLPTVRAGKLEPLFGLSLQDAGLALKYARDEVNLCLDQINEAVQHGNLEAVNAACVPLADSLEGFFKAAKEAASTVPEKAEQEKILWHSNEVFQNARKGLSGAHDYVLENPENLQSLTNLKSMNEGFLAMTQALNSTILALPGNKTKHATELIRDMDDELGEFHATEGAFDKDLKTGAKRLEAFGDLRTAKCHMTSTLQTLIEAASNGDKEATQDATEQLVTVLGGYKNAVKGAMMISNTSTSTQVQDWARRVVKDSAKIAVEAQALLKDPDNKEKQDKINFTSSQIKEAMNEVDSALRSGFDSGSETHNARKLLTAAFKTVESKMLRSMKNRKDLLESKDMNDVHKIQDSFVRINEVINNMDPEVTTDKDLENLILAARELAKPAKGYIQMLREIASNCEDQDKKNEINAEADKLERKVQDLDQKLKTCSIVQARNLIVALWDDLAVTKSSVEAGNPVDPSNKGLTKDDFLNAGAQVHSTVDKMSTSALEGNTKKLTEEANSLAEKLKTFGATAKGAAANSTSAEEQKKTLNDALQVLENSEKVMHSAYSAVVDKDNWTATKKLLAAAQSLNQSLNNTMLKQKKPEDTAPMLLKCLEDELVDFQKAVKGFDGGALKVREKASSLAKNLDKAMEKTSRNASNISQAASRGDKVKAVDSTVQLVASVEHYRDAAKQAALGVADKEKQQLMLGQLKTVLEKSSKLSSQAQGVRANEKNKTLSDGISKTESELNDSMMNLKNTFTSSTTGCQMASKMVDSLRRDNERALLEGIVKRLSTENMRHLIEDGLQKKLLKGGSEVHNAASKIVASAYKGDLEAVNKDAFPLAEKVWDFEVTAKEIASSLKSDADQKTVLSNLGQVLKNTENLLECAQKAGENAKSEPLTRDLNYASQALNESLTTTLLSIPGKETDTAKEILNSLEAELGEFQVAVQAFDGKSAKAPASASEVRSAAGKVTDSMSLLVDSATAGDRPATQKSTMDMVTAMDHFKASSQRLAAGMKKKEDQDEMIEKARSIIHQSTQLVGRSKKMVDNPGDIHLSNGLYKTEEQIKNDIKNLNGILTKVDDAEKRSPAASLKLIGQASENLKNLEKDDSTEDRDGGRIREDVLRNTKTIFQMCSQDWSTLDSEAKERAATQMAKHYKDMVDSIRAALQKDPNDVSAREAAASIQELGKAISHLIENLDGKDVAENVEKVAASCLGVTKSLNAESKRNQALEQVNKDLGNLAADLETSIMFTTAGIFNPQGEQMSFSGRCQQRSCDWGWRWKKSSHLF